MSGVHTFQQSLGIRRVRAVLSETPRSPADIAKAAFVSEHTFTNHYKAKLLADGDMHIGDWRWHGYGWAPLYVAGPGEAKVKPRAGSAAAASKAWRERTGYGEFRKAQRRLAKPPDYAMAALIGIKTKYQKPRQEIAA